MTETAVTEAPAEVDTGARRGRPRPEDTINRDETVYQALTAPKTKTELAEATGLPANEVYLSLYRLRVANRVRKTRSGGSFRWERVEESTPATA